MERDDGPVGEMVSHVSYKDELLVRFQHWALFGETRKEVTIERAIGEVESCEHAKFASQVQSLHRALKSGVPRGVTGSLPGSEPGRPRSNRGGAVTPG